MSRRTEKMAKTLHHELASVVARLELPGLTTISLVEVTDDLKLGKIWITVMPEKNESQVLALLNSRLFELQQSVNKRFKTKNIPRIKFLLDVSEQYADHINRLLKKL